MSTPSQSGPDLPVGDSRAGRSARLRVGVAALAAICAGVVVMLLGHPALAPLIGWDAGAAVFAVWTWTSIGQLDGPATAGHAARGNGPGLRPTCFCWWQRWRACWPSAW